MSKMRSKGLNDLFGVEKKKSAKPVNKLESNSVIIEQETIEEISREDALKAFELIKSKLEAEDRKKVERLKRRAGGRPKSNVQREQYNFRINTDTLNKLRIIADYNKEKDGVSGIINTLLTEYVEENYKSRMKTVVEKRQGK